MGKKLVYYAVIIAILLILLLYFSNQAIQLVPETPEVFANVLSEDRYQWMTKGLNISVTNHRYKSYESMKYDREEEERCSHQFSASGKNRSCSLSLLQDYEASCKYFPTQGKWVMSPDEAQFYPDICKLPQPGKTKSMLFSN